MIFTGWIVTDLGLTGPTWDGFGTDLGLTWG